MRREGWRGEGGRRKKGRSEKEGGHKGVRTLMFFTMPFSTTASRRFLTFLDVMFTSLPPQVFNSMYLEEGMKEGMKEGRRD